MVKAEEVDSLEVADVESEHLEALGSKGSEPFFLLKNGSYLKTLCHLHFHPFGTLDG